MLPFWVSAALTALFSIFYAQAFKWSENVAYHFLGETTAWGFLVLPGAIFVSMALADFFSPTASGSGIPQLIAGLELAKTPNRFLDQMLCLRMIAVKFFGSCVCVAGGGITGREGPNLQISAAIFNQVYKRWPRAKENISLQSMILAGGAAGLASAFNTPLGGVVFAVEELAKVHISHIRTAIFHAVIIAGILVQAILGNYLYLGRTAMKISGFYEILSLGLAAAAIGLCAGIFGHVSVRALNWRARHGRSARFLMTFVCALIVSLIYYFGGRMALGGGHEVITHLLKNPSEPVSWSLPFIRGFGNLLTYGAGVVGGVFAPALATGASLGAWISQMVGSKNPPLWVLVGMVAFLTGLTRTPFTSMILVLEMTDSHDVILVLMLAAVVAQGAAKLIDPISFYEHAAHRYLGMAARFNQDKPQPNLS